MTPFDRLQGLRALSYAAMAACATVAIVVTTDEQYSTAAMRLARLSAIAPLLGAVAVFASAHHAFATGETLALRSLGVPPWRVARGAVYGAWVVAAFGVAFLALPATDVRSLFPVVHTSTPWVLDGAGSLVSAELGIRVGPGGAIAFVNAPTAPVTQPPYRLAALLLAAPAAALAPIWASTPASWLARVAAVVASGGAGIVALHLVAAGRAPAVVCVAPSLLLAAHGLLERAARR